MPREKRGRRVEAETKGGHRHVHHRKVKLRVSEGWWRRSSLHLAEQLPRLQEISEPLIGLLASHYMLLNVNRAPVLPPID